MKVVENTQHTDCVIGFGVSSFELMNEGMLDPSISFDAPLTKKLTEPAGILLTGATGFLGAFLLKELLNKTRANIYCLVRASDVKSGQQRISATLTKYLPGKDWNDPRIIPVPGDLTKPWFGLSSSEFTKLAEAVDCVYHNGASVKLVYSYELLKSVNVLGTEEAIRFASWGKLKPLHYVSTFAAFPYRDSDETRIIREQEWNFDGMLYGGYLQSKWVAEQKVGAARARGLPVAVYRPGFICGNTQTGAWNTGDVICQLIKMAVESAICADIDGKMDMTPVDYVSRAIVHLACSGQAAGQIYHLVNPEPVSFKKLNTWMRSYGYPLRRIPYEAWRAAMLAMAACPGKKSLSSFILPFFNAEAVNEMMSGNALDRILISILGARYGTQVQVDCENTVRSLAGTGITCASVDDRLLETYFSYLVRVGFIPPPAR